jgi:hypothetical protein
MDEMGSSPSSARPTGQAAPQVTERVEWEVQTRWPGSKGWQHRRTCHTEERVREFLAKATKAVPNEELRLIRRTVVTTEEVIEDA